MRVYFIPGLGADRRTFEKLRLDEKYIPVYIEWLEPEKEETIGEYALRLAEQINTNGSFSLVGLSFGGIIAHEIAQVLKPEHVVIISSFKPGVIPGIIKFFRFLKLYYLIPYKLVKSPNKVTYKIFGAQNQEDKELLDQIMAGTDVGFFKWALKSMIKYIPADVVTSSVHIHGSRDRVISLRNVDPDIVIDQGTHFMVYNMADKISVELNKIFEKREQKSSF